jgi:hypothetical protein
MEQLKDLVAAAAVRSKHVKEPVHKGGRRVGRGAA